MANFSLFFPTLLIHEGGFVNNSKDKGGATNLGITFRVWLANGYDKDGDGDIDIDDLKEIEPEDARKIAKKLYWDKIRGDEIHSQSVAEFLFDWAYNSGYVTAIKKVQKVLDLRQDGVIGPITLSKINNTTAKTLFSQLKVEREVFFHNIVKNNPSQAVFLRGWLNRNKSFTFHD